MGDYRVKDLQHPGCRVYKCPLSKYYKSEHPIERKGTLMAVYGSQRKSRGHKLVAINFGQPKEN